MGKDLAERSSGVFQANAATGFDLALSGNERLPLVKRFLPSSQCLNIRADSSRLVKKTVTAVLFVIVIDRKLNAHFQ